MPTEQDIAMNTPLKDATDDDPAQADERKGGIVDSYIVSQGLANLRYRSVICPCQYRNEFSEWSWAGHGYLRCKNCRGRIYRDDLRYEAPKPRSRK